MRLLNAEPSPVVIWNVLLEVYQFVLSIPATEATAAAVIRPSAAIVIIGISVAEPYCAAVTPEAAMSVVIVPSAKSVKVTAPVTSPERVIVGSGLFVAFVKSR